MKLRTNLAALASFSLLAFAATAQAQTTVYTQATDGNGGFASQNDTNPGGFGNFATTFDDFTLGSSNDIGSVTWVGSFFNGSVAPISAFDVDLYADNAGVPGGVLSSTHVTGNANQTSLGTDNVGDPLFSYSANLTSPFSANAGTKYWLSIEPSVGFPPQWAWETGTGGDGAAWQVFMGTGSRLPNDLAFTLVTPAVTPTPEFGSVFSLGGLLAAGGAGMWIRRRRSKSQA